MRLGAGWAIGTSPSPVTMTSRSLAKGWTHEPFAVTLDSGRLFGRGLVDNLGTLYLRFLALDELGEQTPTLTFVGEGPSWSWHLVPTPVSTLQSGRRRCLGFNNHEEDLDAGP